MEENLKVSMSKYIKESEIQVGNLNEILDKVSNLYSGNGCGGNCPTAQGTGCGGVCPTAQGNSCWPY